MLMIDLGGTEKKKKKEQIAIIATGQGVGTGYPRYKRQWHPRY